MIIDGNILSLADIEIDCVSNPDWIMIVTWINQRNDNEGF